ncbi:Cache domain-containing protein [Desulfotomaculum arcticum]|uniref:Cache domain-containing protein n=1 Tax=Desulfotruncus arcticus DSM 17038 TaxID=1121424 RepID=A0A1I2PFD6_9FIRM|nr:methyl-accepting chemotaxis protein [Desulfotruncus arcticus]SFG12707.1 Cache domain-containing protein [Desulfotomaculum arcticum] [Desulfotruncus arcticus DSM 17038]
MKSIKHKLILYIAIILLLVCGGLGVIAYQNAAKSLIANAEETLPVLAVEGSKIVENKLDGQLSVLEANAARERVSNVDNTWEDKKLILNNEVKRMGHLGMAIVDTNGNALSSNGATSNVADSEYFQKALSGQRAVSDPFMSEEYNALVMVYAVPIKNGDSVVGVLTATRDGKELSDITSAITYAKSGKAFMINKNCITIAHSNIELVENRDNDLENVKKDPQLQTLVELEKRMMAGETGVGEYEYNGVFKYMGFAPLESTGWSIAVAAPKDEVLAGLANMKKSSLGASLIFLILAILGVLVVARMITATLKASLNHLKLISQGDFSVTIEDKYHRIKDETGDIVRAADTLQKTMRELVGHLAEKAETLSASSQQLTSSSQQTSASAAETASAMSEMAGTVEQVNQNMQQVVSVSRLTSEHAEKGNQGLDMVNRQMETIAGQLMLWPHP